MYLRYYLTNCIPPNYEVETNVYGLFQVYPNTPIF